MYYNTIICCYSKIKKLEIFALIFYHIRHLILRPIV